MDFTNHTPFPAKLLTGATGEREIVGVVGCKVTYRLEEERLMPVTGDDAWPVFDKPYEFEGVSLSPDLDFRKKGIDILVFGKAMAPQEKPVPWMRVAVECGQVRHEVAVFGDRVWRKKMFKFAPSEPEPFVEMPLTNDRAFGGKAKMYGAEVEHPVNPDGRGYLFEKEEVEGALLPNLEDPDALIETWRDHPRPACFFKPLGVLEKKNVPEEPPEKVPFRVMPTLFNQAVPDLVAQPEDLGDSLRLIGFDPAGDIVFPMPSINGPTVHAKVGDLHGRFPAALSTLLVLARERVLVACYVALFRYLMRPMEKRQAELKWPEHTQAEQVVTREGSHG
jgi:hypothetical protein